MTVPSKVLEQDGADFCRTGVPATSLTGVTDTLGARRMPRLSRRAALIRIGLAGREIDFDVNCPADSEGSFVRVARLIVSRRDLPHRNLADLATDGAP